MRAGGVADADGNFVFGNRLLRPWRLPIITTKQKIEEYLRAGPRAVEIYDPLLGWAPRPNAVSRDGLYQYNSQTLRAPREYAAIPPTGTIRIALFGDSFIHGDEVPFEQSFGYQLERKLNADGYVVEVLNFGVPGYGTDQAFLRWRSRGKAFSPQIVIVGIYPDDVRRNVNLIRPLCSPTTGTPLSKPRFILTGEQLALVNMPPIPPERVTGVMEHLGSWELAPYEYCIGTNPFLISPWPRSLALTFLVDRLGFHGVLPLPYDLTSEPARLMLQILRQFRNEAEDAGSKFVVVHLPGEFELRREMHNQPLDYADLFAAIAQQADVVAPDRELLAHAQQASIGQLFGESHYSRKGNELVAAAVAARLERTYLRRSGS